MRLNPVVTTDVNFSSFYNPYQVEIHHQVITEEELKIIKAEIKCATKRLNIHTLDIGSTFLRDHYRDHLEELYKLQAKMGSDFFFFFYCKNVLNCGFVTILASLNAHCVVSFKKKRI